MSNVDFFDELARKTSSNLNTARMFSFNFNVYRDTYKDINKKMAFNKGDRVLDLGGGCGQITKFIAEQCRSVFLADGAKEAINLAQKKLKQFDNIEYFVLDITKLPLPFADGQLDKIVCYSVVHYLQNHDQFADLIKDLLRITRPGGKILIGDIPLQEKYQQNLSERKKYPVKNFVLNQKYYFKKYITLFIYKIKGLDTANLSGTSYTKDAVKNILYKITGINYQFYTQDIKLHSANSREDLLITKHN